MAVADYKKKPSKSQRHHQRSRRHHTRQKHRQKRNRNTHHVYRVLLSPLEIEEIEYKVTLIRTDKAKKSRRVLKIGREITSINWTDGGDLPSATITLQRQDESQTQKKEHMGVKDGNKFMLEAKIQGDWKPIWTMRVWDPEEELGQANPTTVTLYDDLTNMQHGSDDYHYTDSKKDGPHKNGWYCHEIAEDVCKQNHIHTGELAKGKKLIKDLTKNDASPYDVILAAYAEERKDSGRRYIMRWHEGKFTVTRLQRSTQMLSLRQLLISATSGRARGDKFITALDVIGSVEEDDPNDNKKKKKKKQVTVTVESPSAVRQYGYILGQYKAQRNTNSKEDLRRIGKRIIAHSIRRRTADKLQATHPCIPTVRKGDTIEVRLPEYGYKNKPRPTGTFKGGFYNILFVSSVTHNVAAGSSTMDITFSIRDPVAEMKDDIQDAKDRKRREKKRKDRNANKNK